MPPESFSYQKAQEDFSRIKELREAFDTAVVASRSTGDRTNAKALKQELASRMTILQERLFPLEREYHFKDQYASQEMTLEKAGILKSLSSNERGIVGIDQNPYPLPSLPEVMASLREKRDILNTKAAQGFSRLRLVPFGMSLDDLSRIYGDVLLKHFQEGMLLRAKAKDTDPDEIITDLNTAEPLWHWDAYQGADVNGTLVYEPKEFSENNQGKTKAEILQINGGWRILLLEQNPIIPREGRGEEIGALPSHAATAGKVRKQLEANKTPNDYLKIIGQGPYQHESGLTPEDWLVHAITQLEETNQVLDDWQGEGSIAYLTGAYFPAARVVPSARWSRDLRQALLGGFDPEDLDPDIGVRSAVRVHP